jgi:predicted Zn-dependent protease
MLATAPAVPSAQVRLPSLGDSGGESLAIGAERRIGEQIMAQVRRDPAYLDDPVLLDYVQSLWSPLVDVARDKGEIGPETDSMFAWEAFLVRARSVNAFALPGGFVGVHLGLIAMTATRDELASVLAHELTHVTQRHIARRIDDSSRTSMLAIAGLLLGMLAASQGNADMANAAIVGGQAASVQGQLNFSREMEREADRVGFNLLAGAGFAPEGMASMFEKMAEASRLNDSNAFPYLRTHPLTIDRISEARSRVLLRPPTAPAPPLAHRLMRARAAVLMERSPAGLERLQAQVDAAGEPVPAIADDDRPGALYGAALAASARSDHATALAASARLDRQVAPAADPVASRLAALLRAEVQLAAGDAYGALRTVDALAPGARPSRAAMLMRAQSVLAWHRQAPADAAPALRRSVETLQTWLADHRADAGAWNALAAASAAAGLRLRGLRAEAEARYALGDLVGAIDRLRAAQEAARDPAYADHIEASVIDARLRELRAQRREQLAEMQQQR